ncbi:YVTN family beta-propeller repeat protein [Paenibacillus glycinis]|uniref:YNCE-like beta-propeller domain-containing protein n=1 Tax=Paenibacillus glycinis TaxID=2697035 RepID=A0ABW9XLK9_9BACL|nr:hypothetical protein [Paenibacillus glycinis]NBD23509.1 hypothetical protein [Paenibacillus glycinis]
MPVYDTGPIENRSPRTTSLVIRLMNGGRDNAIASIQAYTVASASEGFSNPIVYEVYLVHLFPFNTQESTFSLVDLPADLDVFGVRVVTSGLAGDNVSVAVTQIGAGGTVIAARDLTGELARVGRLLFAYNANNSQDTLTVVNTEANTIAATVALPAGSSPIGVAITSDGTRAYVANFGSDSVAVVDTASNAVTASIALTPGSTPAGIAVTPDSLFAYAGNLGNDTVSVIDTVANVLLTDIQLAAGSRPFGLAVTPDGLRVYVAESGLNAIAIISTVTNSVIGTIPLLDALLPIAVAFLPDGSRAYVVNQNSDSVTVVDTASDAIVTTIMAGVLPFGVAVSPDGSRAFVAGNLSNSVIVINTATDAVLMEITTAGRPVSAAFTPDGELAYVSTQLNRRDRRHRRRGRDGNRHASGGPRLAFDRDYADPIVLKPPTARKTAGSGGRESSKQASNHTI